MKTQYITYVCEYCEEYSTTLDFVYYDHIMKHMCAKQKYIHGVTFLYFETEEMAQKYAATMPKKQATAQWLNLFGGSGWYALLFHTTQAYLVPASHYFAEQRAIYFDTLDKINSAESQLYTA